ncbi:MAG: LacI family DNA-binding transcriptional regulator [Betaproteobacteria bacterium]
MAPELDRDRSPAIPHSKQAVTMEEIARQAGVSKSTVSRALSNDPRVNLKTRENVLRLVKELNYRPHAAASGLARRRTNVLGLLIPSAPRSFSDPFYLEFIGGVGDYATSRGFSLLFSSSGHPAREYVGGEDQGGAALPPADVVLVEANRVDGVILTEPEQADPRIVRLRERGTPLVVLGRTQYPDVCWVDGDNTGGARMAVEHLIQHGHRSIGCLTGPTGLAATWNRLLGYREAVTAAGLGFDSGLVVESDFTEAGGRRAMAALLARRPEMTAVFCSNDLIAVGGLAALREQGRRVPEDVALVGFDGIRLGEYLSPTLTTVQQPIYQMGQLAAELLIKMVNGEPPAQSQLSLPLVLRLGESCGCPQRSPHRLNP